ncbi:MAG: hypothetical protein J3Q66DRAFT_375609 [Benniella sp.]|nr:MAG: hypothetical protein J3Q66DRAFT_375609 [Benniella sp.]
MFQGAAFLRSFLLSIFLVVVSTPPVSAQVSLHRTVVSPSSGYQDGKAMYITGGNITGENGTPVKQFFAVDLTASWNASQPAYRGLPDFSNDNIPGPGAMSSDGRRFFVHTKNGGYAYNIESAGWTSTVFYTAAGSPHAAVSDPDTALVYIPFAYKSADGTLSMAIVNMSDNKVAMDNDSVQAAIIPQKSFFSMAWSKPLGGLVYSTGDALYNYNRSRTNRWEELETYGEKPPARYLACLLSASGGGKLVFFGGRMSADTPSQTLDDIYILDVPTRTWKKGHPVESSNGRYGAACAISNDYLIVWGGETVNGTNRTAPEDVMMVYDLSSDTWVSAYSHLARTTPTPTPTPTPDPPHSDASNGISSTAIIVGVAVLVVLMAVGGYVYIVRRRRSKAGDASRKEDGVEEENEDEGLMLERFTKESLDKPTHSPSHDPQLGFESWGGLHGPFGTVHEGLYGTQIPSLNPHTPGVGTPVDECIPQDESERRWRDPHTIVEGGEDREEKVVVYDSREEQTADSQATSRTS